MSFDKVESTKYNWIHIARVLCCLKAKESLEKDKKWGYQNYRKKYLNQQSLNYIETLVFELETETQIDTAK